MGAELFKNIPSKVDDLVRGVRIGRIGLPDLQRPFVWADNKVRDLFDSMMKGYPIGYVMIWESPADYETKKNVIGKNEKIHDEPKELVIDGQQRLTALVAAMYGVVVKDKNFADKEIKISFNPLTREFAVWGLQHMNEIRSGFLESVMYFSQKKKTALFCFAENSLKRLMKVERKRIFQN